MGRPRKYHTNEEKRLAKCLKSKRWYDLFVVIALIYPQRNKSAAARRSALNALETPL
ncbi:hypothetical protein H0H93_015734 [Arthromyces matolae]|nr:hypothetical protein H0H93_015734 [Arthromyces matolae]